MTHDRVSAIIVNYESGNALRDCIESLRIADIPVEIVVVDNGSSDSGVAAARTAFPEARYVTAERNVGFAAGANVGARVATESTLLFLNPDVVLDSSAVRHLRDSLHETGVGVAGPVLDVVASSSREYGAVLDLFGFPIPLRAPEPPLYVPGCALATRADVFHALGGFDERYFLFVEDVDYCWRVLLAGFDVRVASLAHGRHLGGGSTPGGYLTNRGLRTTAPRVVLRERNTLAMLLKCHPTVALVVLAPAYVAQALATAIALAARGHLRLAMRLVAALGWNLAQARRTAALRRDVRASRVVSDAVPLRRMKRRVRKLELLRYGFPGVDPVERDAARIS